MLDSKMIMERLLEDMDCPRGMTGRLVEQIQNLPEDIYKSFEKWFNTGIIDDYEIEGYTVRTIMKKKKNINIIGAYLTLDWLRRAPEQAKYMLEKKEFRS